MDLPLAEPIIRTLMELAERGDAGYAHPGRLPETYAAFAKSRYGVDVDPSRIYVVQDIMRGILATILSVTRPGDGVVINPPVYPPFARTIGYAERTVVEAPLARASDTGAYEL